MGDQPISPAEHELGVYSYSIAAMFGSLVCLFVVCVLLVVYSAISFCAHIPTASLLACVCLLRERLCVCVHADMMIADRAIVRVAVLDDCEIVIWIGELR